MSSDLTEEFVHNTTQELQEERAVAQSLRSDGAAAGIVVRCRPTSERAKERAKRLRSPHLSPEVVTHWVSPLEARWMEVVSAPTEAQTQLTVMLRISVPLARELDAHAHIDRAVDRLQERMWDCDGDLEVEFEQQGRPRDASSAVEFGDQHARCSLLVYPSRTEDGRMQRVIECPAHSQCFLEMVP